MSEALITKRAIAQGLKVLTNTKSFSKITVSDITNSCGLNRQTFYYHFQDKYELLNWIYYNEGFLPVIEGITLENWDEKLLILFKHMKEEHTFYSNTIKVDETCFKDYLFNITVTLFEEAIEAVDEKQVLIPEDKRFFASYFAYGICGTVISWVKNGMKEQPERLAKHLKYLATSCEKLAYERFLS